MSVDNVITKEEADALKEALGFGASMPEEKHNVHTFLHNVATADDTTKTGFLKDEEVGTPRFPTRTYKELALISDKIVANDFLKEYYLNKSEILTSTSLSRQGFLTKLAVVTKRVIEDATKPRKENKGWFKKKNEEEQPLEQV